MSGPSWEADAVDLPPNRLKAALADGRVQIGLWLAMAHEGAAEVAAGAGYDWVLIDGEHGPNDIPRIESQLRAVEGRGAEAVVRVPVNDPVWLKRVLDIGARSVLIPMVETAEEAHSAVAACRFPPAGRRGIGGSIIRASGYGAVPDYVARANDGICVVVQAETARAVDEIDAIAAVEGVDAVFVGPADLAASLGHPGRPDAPEVAAAIAHLISRTRAAGKAAGLIGFEPASFAAMAALGATLIAVGADVVLMAEAIRTRAADARRILSGQ